MIRRTRIQTPFSQRHIADWERNRKRPEILYHNQFLREIAQKVQSLRGTENRNAVAQRGDSNPLAGPARAPENSSWRAAGYPEVKPARRSREICPHKSPSGVIVQTERLFGPIVLGWRLNHTVSSAVKEGHAALVGPLCLGWTNAG
jgi:hypothetical protein